MVSRIVQAKMDYNWVTKGRNLDFVGLWPKLLYWLIVIRGTVATDPRDKVFAAFGLAEIYCRSGVQELRGLVDYNAGIQELYAKLVKTMITATNRLDILLACSMRGEEINHS